MEETTFNGFCGIGDFILSCIGSSRNRKVGELLAKGKKLPEINEILHETTEGVATVKALHTLVKSHGDGTLYKRCTLLRTLYSILYEDQDIKLQWNILCLYQ
eukprot:UN01181